MTSQDALALPAATNMAALQASATALMVLPNDLGGVPGTLRPAAGSVHRLLARSGGMAVDLDAWLTPGGRVCTQNSRGSGGCFDAFAPGEYFNATISDPDRVGAGAPVYVWGVVPDQVASVDVVVSGVRHPALVRDNAVFFELADASVGPDAVERFVVTLDGGVQQTIEA